MSAADLAATLVDLIRSEVDLFDLDSRRIVANRIAELIEPWRPKPSKRPESDLKPMTDGEAKRFEQTEILFGMYLGKTFADVPLDYLEYLADVKRAEWIEWHRYLNSDRVKRERISDELEKRPNCRAAKHGTVA